MLCFKNTTKPFITRIITVFIFCIFVGVIGYISYLKSVANAQYFSVYNSLKSWQITPERLSQKQFNSMLNTMSSVLLKDPKNPHYLHIKANLLVLGISHKWLPKNELNTAKQYLIDAVKLRALWAKTWIDLALLQSYLSGVDDETIMYIQQAEIAGPFDYDVNQAVVDILLENWGSLKSRYKPLLFKHLDLAVMHGSQFVGVFKSAKKRGQLKLICLIINKNEQFKNIQSSWMNTSYCS
ncbi:VpsP family polysaccharide biosynthesis protein [Pseudoalteromonas sp. MMG010]|uniref:VpsP family polysaccharide biosynthesis protein n=1 Tax=Pseudoalteromonas sp. MMG010 TaxID=2822685 RepID=UPI001B3A383B|nr:VpsP family polysaccharide biosynthesis protein [Pseudoalteromonas sp. MMG010]MBQ4834130.1 VpsP family polysaccharide biosynthesis protein [Pseudoalteromonas sp. MMG010]